MTLQLDFTRREDGMPSGQVHDVAIDSNGRVWAATPSGLAIYDGNRIRVLTPRDGLQTQGLRALAVRSDGCVLVGCDTGLDIVDTDLNILDTPTDLWEYGLVDCIFCDAQQHYLGTSRGLLQSVGTDWQPVVSNEIEAGLITAITKSANGALWIATAAGNGLASLANNVWRKPTHADWRTIGKISCIAPTTGDQVVVGGDKGFAEINVEGKFVTHSNSDDADGPVSAVHFFDNTLWVTQSGKLKSYVRAVDTWVLTAQTTTNIYINALIHDDFGNIWAATDHSGLAKISVLHKLIQPVTATAGSPVFAIKNDQHGNLLAVGDQASWRIEHSPEANASVLPALDGQQVWDVDESQDGTLYAATALGLIRIRSDNTIKVVDGHNETLNQPGRCLLRANNELLVGTLGGCVAYTDNQAPRTLTTIDGQPVGYVYTMILDRTNQVWAGTLGNGLWLKKGESFERVPGELLKNTGNTYAISVRIDNTLAFIQDDGIFIKPPGKDIRLLTRTSDPIAGWAVQWGSDGSLWTGSASGLAQYNTEDGRLVRRLTALLGLSNWEFTTSRSLFLNPDGSFYCGLNSGLVHVKPDELESLTLLPTVKPDSVEFHNAQVQTETDQLYVVQPGRWTLNVSVYAAWFLDEKNLKYRYRLLGFEDDWSPLGKRPSIQFSSLPPGEYQLEAQAVDDIVGPGPSSTVLNMRVETPAWTHHWLLRPVRGIRALMNIERALFRNKRLREQAATLEDTVQLRTADLVQAKKHLDRVNTKLKHLTITDELTGISNRRHFNEQFDQAISDARTQHKPLSLVLIDIDHFKPYNDIYGHTRGDKCLSFVARKLEASLYRPTDIAARYGGEEFALILPNTNKTQAEQVAERICKSIVELHIEHKGSPEIGLVSVSAGTTTYNAEADDLIDANFLINQADTALYQAKESGRNTWVHFLNT